MAKASKTLKTFVLLAALSGLLIWVGGEWGGTGGLWIALGFAVMMNGTAYFFSHKIALKMARAEPMSEADHPQIHAMVRSLAQKADQPAPDLYISPSPQLNAFATGRNPKHGVVCVNQGLLEALTLEEVEGVVGHELQHVYNRDILVGSVAAILAAAITMLARLAFWFGGSRGRGGNPYAGILMVILAPIAAMIIQAAVTRSRESLADHTGAELTGKPLALASALRKLDAAARDQSRWRRGGVPAETSQAFAHLYITAPFGGATLRKLFSTHPPAQERIAALEDMARKMGQLGPDPYAG